MIGVDDGVSVLLAVDVRTGDIGPRQLRDVWVGSYAAPGPLADDEHVIVNSMDLHLVYRR